MEVEPGDYSIHQLTLPAFEPMTLAQAKDHLRIDQTLTEEDADISDMIVGARSYIEQNYGIRMVKQTVEMTLQNFPRADRIRFPIWPVQSVDYFRYTDVADVTRTMVIGTTSAADLLARIWVKPSEVVLPFAKIWPAQVLQMADGIRIGLTVGFLSGASPELLPIPGAAIRAMKLLIGHYYENRSAVTLGTLMKSEPLVLAVASCMSSVGLYTS